MSLNDLPKVSPTVSDEDNDVNIDQETKQNVPVSSPTPTNITAPNEAADADLIEKEWVERAKQIVDHTRDDPREQQNALSRMKADYMKKRYNKDIKVSNE